MYVNVRGEGTGKNIPDSRGGTEDTCLYTSTVEEYTGMHSLYVNLPSSNRISVLYSPEILNIHLFFASFFFFQFSIW
jgi:hypothetical protein